MGSPPVTWSFTHGDTLGAQGAVAQFGRAPGWHPGGLGVRVPSAPRKLWGYTLAGFVAGEGYFSVSTTARLHLSGEPIQKFVFGVGVEAADVGMLQALQAFLGVGSIRSCPAGRPNWKPQVVYSVRSIKAHREATIPFADRYLLPCKKRDQFDSWRNALEVYAERHKVRWGQGRSQCAIEGCDRLVRGRGLCRIHYYRVTGW